jgi:hypothetical protein
MFSVCAILYGDYPNLAKDLLSSFRYTAHIQDIRLGLNAVSKETKEYVEGWATKQMKSCPVYLYEEEQGKNLGKYPLMRQMFKDRQLASKTMWFDDDSFLDATYTDWWDKALILSKQHTQVGALHKMVQHGRQHEVVIKQPWFTGKPFNARSLYVFATGGWWVADTAFLAKWDYPFADLYHNGGDSILGEVVRQQGGSLGEYHKGVQCYCENCQKTNIKLNAVVRINVGGRSGRRGIGKTDEQVLWKDGNVNPSLAHQSFELKITRYENGGTE